MYTVPFSHLKMLPVLLLLWALPALTFAQANDPMPDRFEQLKRRMDDQMRRVIPMDSLLNGGSLQISPDSNSFFYFRVDTNFGGVKHEFFDLFPFRNPGEDDFFSKDFFNFDSFFDWFFPDSPSMHRPRPGQPDREQAPDDGLLPEERLRLQEKAPKPTPEPKVKTIRI